MNKLTSRKIKHFYLWPALIVLALLVVIFGPNGPRTKISPANASPTPIATYTDFHLLIPSLFINAPVIADVDGNDKKTYDAALGSGVAQLRGSAKPGEGSNIFLFGHSSYYWWASGDYKRIFAKLPSIREGDEIIIWYNSKEYKYKVTGSKTVTPDEVNVAYQTTFEQLSLMTCVPVGTNQKRLIVTAKPE